MPKPGGCHPSGISLGDVLRLPKRHPAWRRREAQSGSCMERENLAGDAKGKGTSGSNREAESTDAPERGGLLRISDEAGKCPWSEGSGLSPLTRVNRQREEPDVQWKAAAFVRWHEPDKSRGFRPALCEARGEIPRLYSAYPAVSRCPRSRRVLERKRTTLGSGLTARVISSGM